jgi:hypothetical protein
MATSKNIDGTDHHHKLQRVFPISATLLRYAPRPSLAGPPAGLATTHRRYMTMSEPVEWDFLPTKRHRRPRIEILPPERQFVRVTVERRRPNVVPLLIIVVAVFVVLRLGIGPWIMLAAILGWLPK